MTDKAVPDRDEENFGLENERSGARLVAAMQTSPHRDLEISPLSLVFTLQEVVYFE